MANFVVDSFTEASGIVLTNHTGETGASWTAHPDSATTPRTTTSRVRGAGSGLNLAYASGAPASADYEVEADMVVLSTSFAGSPGVAGRLTTSANRSMYSVRYVISASSWDLLKDVSGSSTVLGSWTESLATNDVRNVRLRMVGTSIKMFVDDVERASVTDSAISAAGVVGVRFGGNASWSDTTGQQLDNLLAADVTTGVSLSFATTVPAPTLAVAVQSGRPVSFAATVPEPTLAVVAEAGQVATAASVVTNQGFHTIDTASEVAADLVAAVQPGGVGIESSDSPSGAVFEVALSSILTADGQRVKYTYGKRAAAEPTGSVTFQIRSPDGSTLVREWQHADVGVWPQNADHDISDLTVSGAHRGRLIASGA